LLVLINPSNPTGVVIPPQEVERIAAVAEAHDLTIIADESLDESLTGTLRHKSVAAFREAADRTLVVGSFSYLHGLASWRVGYFAGPKSIVQPVRDLKQAMTICTSAMSQYAALEAMTGPQEWLQERRRRLDEKRALAYQALDDMGLPHSRSGAGPYVFVDVTSTGRDDEAFADWLFDEVQVSVLPGSRFGSQGEGFVRISLWPTATELEQALRRMKWALDRASGGGQ
jgi:aspartate/methionine/tyrosine aminotransferase